VALCAKDNAAATDGPQRVKRSAAQADLRDCAHGLTEAGYKSLTSKNFHYKRSAMWRLRQNDMLTTAKVVADMSVKAAAELAAAGGPAPDPANPPPPAMPDAVLSVVAQWKKLFQEYTLANAQLNAVSENDSTTAEVKDGVLAKLTTELLDLQARAEALVTTLHSPPDKAVL
jgi:hypothetical protein